jgi:hypothetical protein
MIIKEYTKEYKNHLMFLTVHHSLLEVSVHNFTDDSFIYRDRFIDYSPQEVFENICKQIDAKSLGGDLTQ